MYHATTTDLPLREPLPHEVAYCLLGACVPLLGLFAEFQPTRELRSSVYRESTVMCFTGKPNSPVGIRLL